MITSHYKTQLSDGAWLSVLITPRSEWLSEQEPVELLVASEVLGGLAHASAELVLRVSEPGGKLLSEDSTKLAPGQGVQSVLLSLRTPRRPGALSLTFSIAGAQQWGQLTLMNGAMGLSEASERVARAIENEVLGRVKHDAGELWQAAILLADAAVGFAEVGSAHAAWDTSRQALTLYEKAAGDRRAQPDLVRRAWTDAFRASRDERLEAQAPASDGKEDLETFHEVHKRNRGAKGTDRGYMTALITEMLKLAEPLERYKIFQETADQLSAFTHYAFWALLRFYSPAVLVAADEVIYVFHDTGDGLQSAEFPNRGALATCKAGQGGQTDFDGLAHEVYVAN